MTILNNLNFSGGPGVLPQTVLEQVQRSIISVPKVGLSILGISHRSDWFVNMVAQAEENIRQLIGLSEDFAVLFLQGGATQQFATVPMTLCRPELEPPEYLHTGYWSGKAITQARQVTDLTVVWDGEALGFNTLPTTDALNLSSEAAYFHYVSNETVEGIQFKEVPGLDSVPRVCDMSSDFLTQPIDADRYSIIYAHAQKNIGPAGVTVVLVRKTLLQDAPTDIPGFLDYRNHIQAHSNYNTPPVFAIYVVYLVTLWLLEDVGGLEVMQTLNTKKNQYLYDIIDQSQGFYRASVEASYRSRINVSFDLPTSELQHQFLEASRKQGFSGLAGHRSKGGIRASLYNGMTFEAVEKLGLFMQSFHERHF